MIVDSLVGSNKHPWHRLDVAQRNILWACRALPQNNDEIPLLESVVLCWTNILNGLGTITCFFQGVGHVQFPLNSITTWTFQ